MAAGPIELLSRARAGETEALGELCTLYRNYLRMVVRTGLGPRLSIAAMAALAGACALGTVRRRSWQSKAAGIGKYAGRDEKGIQQ